MSDYEFKWVMSFLGLCLLIAISVIIYAFILIKQYKDSNGKKPDFLWDIRTKQGIWQYANPDISNWLYKHPILFWRIGMIGAIVGLMVIIFFIIFTVFYIKS